MRRNRSGRGMGSGYVGGVGNGVESLVGGHIGSQTAAMRQERSNRPKRRLQVAAALVVIAAILLGAYGYASGQTLDLTAFMPALIKGTVVGGNSGPATGSGGDGTPIVQVPGQDDDHTEGVVTEDEKVPAGTVAGNDASGIGEPGKSGEGSQTGDGGADGTAAGDKGEQNTEGEAANGEGAPDGKPSEPSNPAESSDPSEPSEPKRVALTFDDGPDAKYTTAILDILKERQIKATFFVVGTQVVKYPEVLQRMVDEGHAIGNHTQSHKDLSKLSRTQILSQMKQADDEIVSVLGYKPSLFRAPYGAVSDTLRKVLKEHDRRLVGWTVDTRDWAGTSIQDMRDNIRQEIKPDGIILMHSFGGKHIANTVEMLPDVIDDLIKRGYTFATIDEIPE